MAVWNIPENRRAYMAKYREKNREQMRKLGRDWAAKNHDHLRAYMKEYRLQLKAKTDAIKIARGCERCGSKPTDPALLHFHHPDPSVKVAQISGNRFGPHTVDAEIAKCVVWCRSCHMSHHAPEKNKKRWASGRYRTRSAEVQVSP